MSGAAVRMSVEDMNADWRDAGAATSLAQQGEGFEHQGMKATMVASAADASHEVAQKRAPATTARHPVAQPGTSYQPTGPKGMN
jgi:hypothetical protein